MMRTASSAGMATSSNQLPAPVRPSDDEPVLAVLLELHESHGVGVRVQDVGFGDAVLER